VPIDRSISAQKERQRQLLVKKQMGVQDGNIVTTNNNENEDLSESN